MVLKEHLDREGQPQVALGLEDPGDHLDGLGVHPVHQDQRQQGLTAQDVVLLGGKALGQVALHEGLQLGVQGRLRTDRPQEGQHGPLGQLGIVHHHLTGCQLEFVRGQAQFQSSRVRK